MHRTVEEFKVAIRDHVESQAGNSLDDPTPLTPQGIRTALAVEVHERTQFAKALKALQDDGVLVKLTAGVDVHVLSGPRAKQAARSLAKAGRLKSSPSTAFLLSAMLIFGLVVAFPSLVKPPTDGEPGARYREGIIAGILVGAFGSALMGHMLSTLLTGVLQWRHTSDAYDALEWRLKWSVLWSAVVLGTYFFGAQRIGLQFDLGIGIGLVIAVVGIVVATNRLGKVGPQGTE